MSAQLSASLSVPRNEFEVSAELEVERGETLAIMGPNGSGKSTLLQALVGLVAADRHRVILGGRSIHRKTPAYDRRIALLGQDPLVFPHLTVRQNLEFGPRALGHGRAAAGQTAEKWLTALDLGQFAERKANALSGGQQQRVALGRALATEPDLLLLDEPLAAADVETAAELREVLRKHLRAAGQTTILVTHDVLDVAVLADRMLVLDRGEVRDQGPVEEMLNIPRTEFGASLAGLNLLTGTAVANDRIAVTETIAVVGQATAPLAHGSAASAVFAPSSVLIADAHGSPRNAWKAEVLDLRSLGATVRVRLRLADGVQIAADVTASAVAELRLTAGEPVTAQVKATQVRLFSR